MSYSPAQAAQQLGIGRNKLLAWMRQSGLINACNQPTLAARSNGYLRTRHTKFEVEGAGEREGIQPRITHRGLQFLRGRLTEAGLISPAETAKN